MAILLWTAGGTATRTIFAPNQSKIYTVINASSSTQSIILAGVSPVTTGVTIAKGESALCAWNGSDFIKISNTAGPGTFTNLTVTGNTSLGDADTDTITQTASYVTGTQLKSAKTATNTLSLAAYDVDGTAYTNLITLTAGNTPTLALTSTGVGTINNMSIGVTTASTGAFTTLTSNGATTFTAGTASTTTGTGTLVITGGLGVSGRINAANFDGIVGANTAAAGSFTTLSTTGLITSTSSANSTVTTGVFENTSTGTSAINRFRLNGGTSSAIFEVQGSGFSGTNITNGPTTSALVMWTASNIPVSIGVNASEIGRFSSTGLAVTGTLSTTGAVTVNGGAASTAIAIPNGASYPVNAYGATTGATQFAIANTGGTSYFGNESSTAGTSFTGTSAYATLLGTGSARSLQFATNGAVRATIDSSGNLGLGVTPEVWLSSFRSLDIGSTASFAYFSDGLYLYNNTYYTTGSSQVYKQNGYAQSYIQTGTGQHIWQIAPNNTSGADAVINFTQAMTLDASGNLGIGNTSPSSYNSSADNLVIGTSGSNGMTIVSGSTSSGYIMFADGTTGQQAYEGQITYDHTNNFMAFNSNGTERARFNSTGAFVLAGGTTTANGIGITFPTTQLASTDANTLDDYEEGTWTATLVSSGSGAVTISSVAKYTKVGNQVLVTVEGFSISTSSLGAGSLTITGLPFTCNANSPSVAYFNIAGAVSAAQGAVVLYASNSTTMNVYLSQSTSSGITQLVVSDLNSSVSIRFNGSYLV
jgi:hypothetical protein